MWIPDTSIRSPGRGIGTACLEPPGAVDFGGGRDSRRELQEQCDRMEVGDQSGDGTRMESLTQSMQIP